MAKSIKITANDGKDYTLGYTRKTVTLMSQSGFNIEDVKDKPIVALPQLFAGAFLKNHRYIKDNVIDDIWKTLPNKEDLILALIEMYQEPINALIDEPEESEKNSTWEVVE